MTNPRWIKVITMRGTKPKKFHVSQGRVIKMELAETRSNGVKEMEAAIIPAVDWSTVGTSDRNDSKLLPALADDMAHFVCDALNHYLEFWHLAGALTEKNDEAVSDRDEVPDGTASVG